jgi:hypothetical protein
MAMDRRQFVQLTTAGVVAGLLVGACDDADSLARPELLDMLGPDRVRELGAHYRQQVPSEKDAEALRAALEGSARSRPRRFGILSPSAADQVRDDFADGRTVVVNGWVLSLTEARQCALFSLVTS